MRRALAAAATAVALLSALPAAADASCVPGAAEQVYAGSAAAVIGTVAERREATVVLDVRETVRGAVPARIEVRDEGHRTSVGLQTTVGEELGLVLRTQEGPAAFTTTGCLRTTPAELRAIARRAEQCRAGRRERARRLPEGSLRARGPRVVLGCAALANGRRRQLVAYRYARTAKSSRSLLCIETVDLVSRSATGCGSDRVRGTLSVDALTFRGRSVLEVGGAARPAVRTVRVRFRSAEGEDLLLPGAVVRVEDPAVLRALRLRRPFSRFLAVIPEGARRAVVEGLDARGRVIAREVVSGRT